MDVMDVTGDSAVDCTLSRIHGAADRGASDRENYTWFMFEKLGPGTLKITGESKALRMESKLYGGTLLLAGSNIMTNEVQLLGGNFAVDAGKSNSLGALMANKAGTISVGEGGSLSFASFVAGSELAKGAVLIDAPLTGNILKFDTDISADKGYFRWKDDTAPKGCWHVKQDAAGYLHPVLQGTNISIR